MESREQCCMVMRNGKRCLIRAKHDKFCGRHYNNLKSKRKAVERLIQLGKVAGGVKLLIEVVKGSIWAYNHLSPMVDHWFARLGAFRGIHHADGNHQPEWFRVESKQHGDIEFELDLRKRAWGLASELGYLEDMIRKRDYCLLPETLDSIFTHLGLELSSRTEGEDSV